VITLATQACRPRRELLGGAVSAGPASGERACPTSGTRASGVFDMTSIDQASTDCLSRE
jgi:hypothetical protein